MPIMPGSLTHFVSVFQPNTTVYYAECPCCGKPTLRMAEIKMFDGHTEVGFLCVGNQACDPDVLEGVVAQRLEL